MPLEDIRLFSVAHMWVTINRATHLTTVVYRLKIRGKICM